MHCIYSLFGKFVVVLDFLRLRTSALLCHASLLFANPKKVIALPKFACKQMHRIYLLFGKLVVVLGFLRLRTSALLTFFLSDSTR